MLGEAEFLSERQFLRKPFRLAPVRKMAERRAYCPKRKYKLIMLIPDIIRPCHEF
jgi:hypothetical protein